MVRILNILLDVTKNAFCNIWYFIENNLLNFARILNFALPFAMYFVGKYTGSILLCIWVPIAFFIMIYYLKSTANMIGKGITIPIPDKRFTEVDDDGEVSIENNRLQELLLYTADLEDWIERKGLFK